MAYSLDVDLSFEQEIPVDLSFTQASSRGGSSTPIYNADSSSTSGAYSAAYTNTLISNALVEAKAYTDQHSSTGGGGTTTITDEQYATMMNTIFGEGNWVV